VFVHLQFISLSSKNEKASVFKRVIATSAGVQARKKFYSSSSIREAGVSVTCEYSSFLFPLPEKTSSF
jgi:hypothetical protein